jgi:hypothetical protein
MSKRNSILALAVSFCGALLFCAPAKGQLQMATDDSAMDSAYANEPPSQSGANAELETRFMWDSNIFNDNARQSSDYIYEESALLNAWKNDPRWNFAVQYRPTLLHYQEASGLNSVDNDLKMESGYSFTQRFRVRVNETFDSLTGALEPSSDEYFAVPTQPLSGLNPTLITPTSRELSNSSEAHILYDVSPRGSLDLMGSYGLQTFSDLNGVHDYFINLFDTNSTTAGATYQYRVSPRFTLGGRYLYQNLRYGLGGSDETHFGYLTANWQFGPHIDLDLHGGPEYSTVTGASSQFAAINDSAGTLKAVGPAAGGTFSWRSGDTILQASAEHSITNGGGLLMTVETTYEGLELRRALGRDWDMVLTGTNSRAEALQDQGERGRINAQLAGAAFEHPIFDRLSMHFEYDYMRQRINQFVPLGTNVNMSQFSAALFYRIGASRL